MSEDRLEKALEAMRQETASPEQIAGARDRVREKLSKAGFMVCGEFQPEFIAYLENRLAPNRQLLMEDHLSRCSRCREAMAEIKGNKKVIAMPRSSDTWWPKWRTWAIAAALLLFGVYMARDRIDTLMAPGGPRASIASVKGSLYRVPEGVLAGGATLGQSEIIRTAPGARAVLRLSDGSLVDVNERTELFVDAAWSGQTIHLLRGDIIVQAAKQRRGHLRVQTRDSIASVKGTVFAVSSGLGGSVVSVVEGSVEVERPGIDVVLKPGQQSASKAIPSYSVQDALSWSPDAEKYIALLASFAALENKIAQIPSAALRTQSRLVQYLPAGAFIFGAIPNLGGTIRQAMALAEQQSADNATFREWWNSSSGLELKQLMDRIQIVTPLLGDEIAFVMSPGAPGTQEQIPMVIAEIRAGKQAELATALDALRSQAGNIPIPCDLANSRVIISDTPEHLQWVLDHLGQGAGSSFAAAIAARYQRGAGWLLGLDLELGLPILSNGMETGLMGAQQMKSLFLEQREVDGAEENEILLTFKGPRMGMASWLASGGSGGAAEYIPSDAAFAVYASTREPRQLFDELTAQLAKLRPSSADDLAQVESKLGAGFVTDIASALGTESALSLQGFSTSGPVWVVSVLVNNPTVLDASIRRLVDVFNAELPADKQASHLDLSQESVDGRNWSTLKTSQSILQVTWTYDRGYLVAASDRGAALRAIGARSGASALVWSPTFQQQLPSSAMLQPSAFVWLNTKGALEVFASLVQSAALQKLISERDPILVAFNGFPEQIHSASRTRLSGLIVDAMLLENLGRAGSAQGPLIQQQVKTGKR